MTQSSASSSFFAYMSRWLGLAPFLIFALLFLALPTLHIVLGAFQNPDGNFTLENVIGLAEPSIVGPFWVSMKISAITALLGCLIGFLLAAAVIHGGLPKALRSAVMTFSGVASNFAGVPLSFAFIATLGRLGLITVVMREVFGFNIYGTGFNLISFFGLCMVYLYFQIPLMVLIITPALDGLKREWREAAECLGATGLQYWRMVAFPVLWPSLLGTFALLAMALTGSSLTIVPIKLFAQIRGDTLQNPNLGYAIAFGMIVITGIANVVYIVLRARAERWMK
jgi:putative spermidine/putrescine transport system permease protein